MSSEILKTLERFDNEITLQTEVFIDAKSSHKNIQMIGPIKLTSCFIWIPKKFYKSVKINFCSQLRQN